MNRKHSWIAIARLALCWLLPFICFAALELALRAVGYGENLAPITFSSQSGDGYWVFNDRFLGQFLRIEWNGEELDAPKAKTPNTKRIAIFGESAAHGYPAREFAFPRCLDALLRERYPDTGFEFLNLAYPGVDSHILYAQARAAAATFKPDAFIVYMGNNEGIGPFGPQYTRNGKITVPGIWRVRATIAFNRLRLTQLCRAWLAPQKKPPIGMNVFGPKHPEAPRIYDNFRTNLRDIRIVAENAGIPVVLCTVATALRDWTPNEAQDKTLRPPEWTAHFNASVERWEEGQYALALSGFEAALEQYPDDAELHFRIGQCHWALGDFAKAKVDFHAARECDDFSFARARDPINAAIRNEAAARLSGKVFFADVEAGIADASENGIPGFDCFSDQCHFSFRGAVATAQTILPALTQALELDHAIPVVEDTETAMRHCVKALAFSKDAFDRETEYRRRVLELYNRFNKKEMGWWMDSRMDAAVMFSAENGVELYRNAVALMPTDYLLSLELTNVLMWGGRLEEALELARATVSRYPCRREAKKNLAQVLACFSNAPPPGDESGAAAAYAKEALDICIRLEKEGFAQENLLSTKVDAFFALEQYANAAAAADELLAREPDNVVVWCRKGDATARLGKNALARDAYLEAIERDRCNVGAYKGYQEFVANTMDVEGQIVEWRQLILEVPESPFPQACLGDTFFAANRCTDALAAYLDAANVTESPCDLQYFRDNLTNRQIECGYRFLKEERYEEAKALFQEAWMKRRDLDAVLGMAAIYRKENNPEREEELLKNAIVEMPAAVRLHAQYDDFLLSHYGEEKRKSAWEELKREHPELPFFDR